MNIKRINRDKLPIGLREPFRDLRWRGTNGNATVFGNNERFLPPAKKGNTYYEHDVGEDRTGGRGRFRLVVLVGGGGELLSAYFTSAHYMGEWTEITW